MSERHEHGPCCLGTAQCGVGMGGAEAVCSTSSVGQGDFKRKGEPSLMEKALSTLDICFEVVE